MNHIVNEFINNKFLHNIINENDKLADPSQTIMKLTQLLDALLNNPYEKIVITNRDGNIVFMNDAYAKLISTDKNEVIGKNVLHVLGKESRMHIVGKTLKPEMHALFSTANMDAVARRIPLISGENILGVMGKDLFDNLDDLSEMARQAYELHRVYSSYRSKRESGNRAKYGLVDIISEDSGILRLKELVKSTAQTSSTVLLQGETGVGKELFAHGIHRESKRAYGPFVRVNCGAIPESLLESELFGYDEGAFTGAKKGGKPGKFELAEGGTILLDEIGEIPLHSQVKILRVLQEKEVERVGGTQTLPIDVRVIASTNKNLWQLYEEGKFRLDLYYRLNVVSLTIPPLRERRGDIPFLVQHLINKYNHEFGLNVQGINKKELRRFLKHDWPGNIRELESLIESSMNLIKRDAVILNDFPPLSSVQRGSNVTSSLKESLNDLEAELLLNTLDNNNWDLEKTAAQLDVSVASLYRKIKKHQIKFS